MLSIFRRISGENRPEEAPLILCNTNHNIDGQLFEMLLCCSYCPVYCAERWAFSRASMTTASLQLNSVHLEEQWGRANEEAPLTSVFMVQALLLVCCSLDNYATYFSVLNFKWLAMIVLCTKDHRYTTVPVHDFAIFLESLSLLPSDLTTLHQNSTLNRWIDEPMNRWIAEVMNRWNDESMNRWNDDFSLGVT